jgi:predicted metallo-beta-lactamase superfamily hydrolase
VVSGLFHLPFYHYDNLTAIFDLVYASPPGNTSQRIVAGDILFVQDIYKLFENNDNDEKNEKTEERKKTI